MDEKEKKLLEKYVREHYWELNKAIDEGFKEFLKQKKEKDASDQNEEMQ